MQPSGFDLRSPSVPLGFGWCILLGFVFLYSGSVLWPVLMHFSSNLLAILGHSNSSSSVFGAWPAIVGIRVWMREVPVWATIPGLLVLIAVMLCICIRISRIKNDYEE